MSSKTRKITLGTKEWADSNVNCYYGCSNNCKYCYAKKMAIRFKRKTENTWKIMEPNQKTIEKRYSKRKGRIMFPTSHDITPESLSGCLIVLKKLLDANNEVLITTKPNLNCIKFICNNFYEKRDLIQFRFTITSMNNDLLSFWEPNAPLYKERLESLIHSYNTGYKTSISIEPFLDKDPYLLVDKLTPYVTESIWIGKMNYVYTNDVKFNEIIFYKDILRINDKENLMKIIEEVKKCEKGNIQIKDSVYNSISR